MPYGMGDLGALRGCSGSKERWRIGDSITRKREAAPVGFSRPAPNPPTSSRGVQLTGPLETVGSLVFALLGMGVETLRIGSVLHVLYQTPMDGSPIQPFAASHEDRLRVRELLDESKAHSRMPDVLSTR